MKRETLHARQDDRWLTQVKIAIIGRSRDRLPHNIHLLRSRRADRRIGSSQSAPRIVRKQHTFPPQANAGLATQTATPSRPQNPHASSVPLNFPGVRPFHIRPSLWQARECGLCWHSWSPRSRDRWGNARAAEPRPELLMDGRQVLTGVGFNRAIELECRMKLWQSG